jgi:hypothetical protein
MQDFSRQPGRFETTARLFDLVAALPFEKRLDLLERLLGERLAAHLMQRVIEMSADRRQILYDQLAAPPSEEAPVITVNLDGDDSLMRQSHRKACRLKAIYVAGTRTLEALVTDIGTAGLFLKTDAAHPAGKKIRISTRLPGLPQALILNGVIMRSDPAGMAVRFESLKADQMQAIKGFIAARTMAS